MSGFTKLPILMAPLLPTETEHASCIASDPAKLACLFARTADLAATRSLKLPLRLPETLLQDVKEHDASFSQTARDLNAEEKCVLVPIIRAIN